MAAKDEGDQTDRSDSADAAEIAQIIRHGLSHLVSKTGPQTRRFYAPKSEFRCDNRRRTPLFSASIIRLPASLRRCSSGAVLSVDSASRIKYSGLLARCCAWGLWVFNRTRLVDSPMGAAGTGKWLLNAGCQYRVQCELKPLEGQPPQSSPEQICLEVGGIKARARFAWAIVFCAAAQKLCGEQPTA